MQSNCFSIHSNFYSFLELLNTTIYTIFFLKFFKTFFHNIFKKNTTAALSEYLLLLKQSDLFFILHYTIFASI